MKYAAHGWYYYPTAAPCAAGDEICEFDKISLGMAGWDPDLHQNVFFAQGWKTAHDDMPVSGVARYEGKAYHGSVRGGHPSETPASFTADFGNKTLSGKLGDYYQFNADINGNRFATNYELSHQTDSEGRVAASGGFYGPQAAELAGVYNAYMHSAGSFGAKKAEPEK
ncbi:transferrin-binding protein-like solute binding protein [Neisseria dentiae]|uniref:transferrin-binding protein-like solute binding protein n=1 Tax=Neisseria dentiae TaxID=194197 RepID=UPI0035A1A630